ncbi:hypothetical protein [Salarchaeum sp. JOR-1]|uniref:hypothetical protein n=1 Tax=Salarchaeum sp. JOR-1 TaxID=2599399 RepID=UPI00143CD926|nr:hypothetical protein [Salarchaeum sp. JOR-1]
MLVVEKERRSICTRELFIGVQVGGTAGERGQSAEAAGDERASVHDAFRSPRHTNLVDE